MLKANQLSNEKKPMAKSQWLTTTILWFCFFLLCNGFNQLQAQLYSFKNQSSIGLESENSKRTGLTRYYQFHKFDPNQFDFGHEHQTYKPFTESIEQQQQLTLQTYWHLNPRLNLFAKLPFIQNQRYEMEGNLEQLTEQQRGFGDLVLGGEYLLYSTHLFPKKGKPSSLQLIHQIWLETAIELPVGVYENFNEKAEIEPQFQAGSGSTDFLFGLNYELEAQGLLLHVKANYRRNGFNKYRYHFGNEYQFSTRLAYALSIKQFRLQTLIGAEWIRQESDEMNNRLLLNEANPDEDTGGQFIWGNAGITVEWSRFLLEGKYEIPVSQNIWGQQLTYRRCFKIGLHFIFTK